MQPMAVMIAERTLSINSLISAIGERSRFAVAVLILYGLVLFLSSLAESGEAKLQPPAAKHRTAFLAAIEGHWAGQARVTPIGPRPYDMTFVRTAPRQVEGEAHPGASIHYWMFYLGATSSHCS
jgi:hypothetical protein